ncbi:MAG: transmembrane-type terpene cyclase [Flavisolibacter sp.]
MHKLFNTVDYTVPQLVLFGIAAAYWVWVYIAVIRDIVNNKFVGIPVLAVCANISWEFLWSFFFYTNMGAFFEWGYRAWFVLDVFIFYSVFRYGRIQFSDPALKKYFGWVIGFTTASWVAAIFAFTNNYSDPVGAISAYLVNAHMSALYILLVLKFPKEKTLSLSTAWHKMLGTALTSVFCFWAFPNATFMLTMTVITFLLDMTYIFIVKYYRKPVVIRDELRIQTSSAVIAE